MKTRIRDSRTGFEISLHGLVPAWIHNNDQPTDCLEIAWEVDGEWLPKFLGPKFDPSVFDGKLPVIKNPLSQEIITLVDPDCPFACPRQSVNGAAKYSKIVIRSYGDEVGEFNDQTIFVGSHFNESKHVPDQKVPCQCPACNK